LSCRGRYEELGADGVEYAHVCGPISTVEAKRAGAWIQISLAELAPADVVRVRRRGAVLESAIADVQQDDLRIGDSPRERPDKRDERAARIPGEEENGRTIERRGQGSRKVA
jgi:hypothetical protein